jgi:hypothetical protein
VGWPLTFGRASLLDDSNHDTLRLLARLAPVAPGARVLLAGFEIATDCSGIAAMGLHVTASVELDSQAETLARNAPEIDSIIGPGPREQFEDSPPDFDLVVIDANEPDRGNLLSRLALMETASLLASLRPGGMLLLYGGGRRGRSTQIGHLSSCCLAHLNRFPGQHDLHSPSRHLWPHSGRRPLIFAATLTVPNERYSTLDWDSFAHVSAEQSPVCCNAARSRCSGESGIPALRNCPEINSA